MIEKIKTNWKNILLVIFVLFSLNKCTQSCNRQTKINKQTKEIAQKDSIISALAADTLDKAHKIDVMGEKINTANEKVNVANAKEETAVANEAAAKAKAETARIKSLRK